MKFDSYDFHYELHRWKEKITMKIVWALPKYIVYWCVIRVWASATSGSGPFCNFSPCDVRVDQALNAWADPVIQYSIAREKLSLEQLDKVANYTINDTSMRWENEITDKMVNIKIWSHTSEMEPFFEYIGVPIEKFSKKS